MNNFGAIFTGQGIALDWNDLRALSQAEMQEYQIYQMRQMQGRVPSFEQMLGLQNYRRSVHVPQGWADWYEHGNELI